MDAVDLRGRHLDCQTDRGSSASAYRAGDVCTTTVVVARGAVVGVHGVLVVVGRVEGGVVVVVVVVGARHVPTVPVQAPVRDAGGGPGAMSHGEKRTVDGTASWTSSPMPVGWFVTLNGPQGSF